MTYLATRDFAAVLPRLDQGRDWHLSGNASMPEGDNYATVYEVHEPNADLVAVAIESPVNFYDNPSEYVKLVNDLFDHEDITAITKTPKEFSFATIANPRSSMTAPHDGTNNDFIAGKLTDLHLSWGVRAEAYVVPETGDIVYLFAIPTAEKMNQVSVQTFGAKQVFLTFVPKQGERCAKSYLERMKRHEIEIADAHDIRAHGAFSALDELGTEWGAYLADAALTKEEKILRSRALPANMMKHNHLAYGPVTSAGNVLDIVSASLTAHASNEVPVLDSHSFYFFDPSAPFQGAEMGVIDTAEFFPDVATQTQILTGARTRCAKVYAAGTTWRRNFDYAAARGGLA